MELKHTYPNVKIVLAIIFNPECGVCFFFMIIEFKNKSNMIFFQEVYMIAYQISILNFHVTIYNPNGMTKVFPCRIKYNI